jgi:hypothetical protein
MLDFLSGAKTFIGGAVLVGGGLAGMLLGVVDPVSGITLIGNGFAVWGIGGKLERLVQSDKPVDLKGKL